MVSQAGDDPKHNARVEKRPSPRLGSVQARRMAETRLAAIRTEGALLRQLLATGQCIHISLWEVAMRNATRFGAWAGAQPATEKSQLRKGK